MVITSNLTVPGKQVKVPDDVKHWITGGVAESKKRADGPNITILSEIYCP
jgi:hypothetical protein